MEELWMKRCVHVSRGMLRSEHAGFDECRDQPAPSVFKLPITVRNVGILHDVSKSNVLLILILIRQMSRLDFFTELPYR